jgi:hypothetical protein
MNICDEENMAAEICDYCANFFIDCTCDDDTEEE